MIRVKHIVIGLIMLASAGFVCHWYFGMTPQKQEHEVRKVRIKRQPTKSWASPRDAVRAALKDKVAAKKPGKKAKLRIVEPQEFARMSPADRRIAETVQKALDREDFNGVSAAVPDALSSKDPALREHVIEALSWFDAQALPELTAFLADADEDVSDLAVSRWQMALMMVDDETRVATAEAVLKTLSNEQVMEQVMGEITGQNDDVKVLESLIAVMDSENPVGVKVAKEAYEALTGEEWSNIEAAEAWLQENYIGDDEVIYVRRRPRK